MDKQETIQIMAMLGAFYGAGKSDPEAMATGWHLILEPYEYDIACKAVLNFAKNDTRDYGTFPTVGNIVKEIEEEMKRQQAPITEVVRAVSYGWHYDRLSDNAKANISEEHYNDWLNMDAEKFANEANRLAEILKSNQQKRLNG